MTNRKERLHKLAALRLLTESMAAIEANRRARVKRGDNVSEVDRDAAQSALTGIAAFFHEIGVESGAGRIEVPNEPSGSALSWL